MANNGNDPENRMGAAADSLWAASVGIPKFGLAQAPSPWKVAL